VIQTYHKSVLTKEVVKGLAIKPNGLYIDATFGGGGHTSAILEAEPTAKVIALDWDKTAIETNGPPLKEKFGDRLTLIWGNFARLHFILKEEKISKIDGILADFGTSQHQIHHKEGFSFQTDTPLDMRMAPRYQKTTAAQMLNNFDEKKLAQIFFELGEEPKARAIARAIALQRKQEKFRTTKQLTDLIQSVAPRKKNQKTNPATKIFQALRIYVNSELANIEVFLKTAIKALSTEGRIVCISFHSLEDRIVKTIYKEHPNELEILTKKPTTATPEELTANPSARSAKLRVASKKSLP